MEQPQRREPMETASAPRVCRPRCTGDRPGPAGNISPNNKYLMIGIIIPFKK